MKQRLTLILFIFCSLSSFASKDRIERPTTFTFIFQNNDTIVLKKPNDSLLKAFTTDILIHKKKLFEVYLTFNTGEALIFRTNGNQWTALKIKINNKEVEVPEKILSKIKEIHFETVALLWPGRYRSATAAGNFHIRFDTGNEKPFDKYPYLQLFFSDNEFSRAEIWRPVDEKTIQWSKF